MRTLLIAALILAASSALASDREPQLDLYYACLVGNAAVEINYGSDRLTAFDVALKACQVIADEIPVTDSDEAHYVEDAAYGFLPTAAPK